MSTYWLKQELTKEESVINVREVDDVIVELSILIKGTVENVTIYKARKEEYVLSVEGIEEAIEKGATIAIYDSWGDVTSPAKVKAKENGIKVFHFGVFMNMVKEGRRL